MLLGFYWRIGPGGKLRRVIADVVISYQGCQSNLTFGRKVAKKSQNDEKSKTIVAVLVLKRIENFDNRENRIYVL